MDGTDRRLRWRQAAYWKKISTLRLNASVKFTEVKMDRWLRSETKAKSNASSLKSGKLEEFVLKFDPTADTI